MAQVDIVSPGSVSTANATDPNDLPQRFVDVRANQTEYARRIAVVVTDKDGTAHDFATVSVSTLQLVSTPVAAALHRSAINTADGTTKPAANNAAWVANPSNYTKCRVFVSTTGSPTTCTLRAYVRNNGASGQVGSTPLQTLNGTPNFDQCFDVVVDGDDILVFIETLSGGAAPTVTVYVSWR